MACYAVADYSRAAIPAAHTSGADGAAGDPGTESCHEAEADKASREEGKLGWKQQLRDL